MLQDEYDKIEMQQLVLKQLDLVKSKADLQNKEVIVDLAIKDTNSLLIGVHTRIAELQKKGVALYVPPKETETKPESGQAKPVGA